MARRRVLVPAVLATLALSGLVTGCSSDDDASPGPSTAATDATAAGSSATDAPTTGSSGAGVSGPLARYVDYTTANYDQADRWICRPDEDDLCDGNLDSTVIAADGSRTVETFAADPDAPIDCFYIYPTISTDKTPFSDWDWDPAIEGGVVVSQAARLGSVCRVFAPAYRQRTLAGMTQGATPDGDTPDPFDDVTDAFRTYMAEDNDGRGIVLIGHSQGASMLRQLLQKEFDPNEDVRALLVGAYLAGGTVTIPSAADPIGGDLTSIPVCTDAAAAGCVTTWSTYARSTPPDAGSIFGRNSDDGVAACVSPAGPGADEPLHAYLPPSAITVNGAVPEVETTFVSTPGLLRGGCASTDSHRYLDVGATDDASDQRAVQFNEALGPAWGLHLYDISVVMGDIVDRVKEQAAAWAG